MQINKSTFYAHCDDIYVLSSAIETEAFVRCFTGLSMALSGVAMVDVAIVGFGGEIKEHFNYKGLEKQLLVALPSESIYRPDLEKLRDQYYTEIITGKLSIDAFDEFVTRWNTSGGGILYKKANEWYATVK